MVKRVRSWTVLEAALRTVELQLDDETLERARQLAAARHVTIEELLKEALKRLSVLPAGEDPISGMFADEPELLDQIVEEAMQARERVPFRLDHG